MDAQLKAFIAKLAERRAAKDLVMDALGEAIAADGRGEDSSAYWATVAEKGAAGDEGRCSRELEAIAKAYIDDHPELFVMCRPYARDGGGEAIARMLKAFRRAGTAADGSRLEIVDADGDLVGQFDETIIHLTMFELVNFERQTIGVAARTKYKGPAGGKVAR